MSTLRLAAALLLVVPTVARSQAPDVKGVEFFENKIRPVLAQHCYQCHSDEAVKNKKLRGGLFVDSRSGLLKGGDSGPAIVPGKAKQGHLLAALMYDGDVKMPPKNKLPPEVIADFVKWIEMGAPDPREGSQPAEAKGIDIDQGKKFWSFQPVRPRDVPNPKKADWARTSIDRFILAKLEEKKLTPNTIVSREKLIRRAYFDLWGLPPTPEAIDAFVKDPAPDAYEKLIDDLLAGHAYGERWGRHWLDVVRFAESNGYEFDANRPGAYHYRDWVIKAFNRDIPYDEFVRQQVAGDIMKPNDFDASSATGFLVAGPYPGQTTAKTAQLIRYNHLDDMVSTIGSSFLGLTLTCSRCHDHKYDPLPQADYYKLIANLARTDSAKRNLDPQPEIYQKAKAHFDTMHGPLNAALDKFEKEQLPKRAEAWFVKADAAKATPATWQIFDAVAETKAKVPLRKTRDGTLRPAKAEKTDTLVIVAQTRQTGIKALRLEGLSDDSLPKSGPGIEPDGTFLLTEITVQTGPIGAKKLSPVKLRPLSATSETKDQTLAKAVDGDPKTGWSIDPSSAGRNAAAEFAVEGDLGDAQGLQFTITLKFDGKSSAIAQPRVAFSTQADGRSLTSPAELQNAQETLIVLRRGEGKLTPANAADIGRWFRQLDSDYNVLHEAIEDMLVKVPPPQPKLVEVFVASGNRGGDVHFLARGEVERKGAKADPGYLQVLSTDKAGLAQGTDPRVGLAKWLTDTDDGAGFLLARVIVNRLWQHHMGRGIVATPNDFGAQGSPPTHPELLDHLAGELIKGGWRLKPLHKRIMTSAVYMQSGAARDDGLKADLGNSLWWRRPPQRLEAEIIRDNLLAVGGSLDKTPYGPGSLDLANPRRSVYLTVKRSQPIPMLAMLDAPEPILSVGERSLTTVPTQSLAFMNSQFVRKQADNLAKRLAPIAAKDLDQALDLAYLTALARRPTSDERERMTAFIAQQAADYGATGRDQALADCCQVILCLNEFVYVD